MRSSLQKLLESSWTKSLIICWNLAAFSLACELKNPTMNQYLNGLDHSSWLQHIKSVLDAAIFTARVSKPSLSFFPKKGSVFLGDWSRKEKCPRSLFRWMGSNGPMLLLIIDSPLSILSLYSWFSGKTPIREGDLFSMTFSPRRWLRKNGFPSAINSPIVADIQPLVIAKINRQCFFSLSKQFGN